jgi:hypothetical protein
MAEMTTRRWRMWRATVTSIIMAAVVAQGQMLPEEISEKKELAHEKEELMGVERRSIISHRMSIYNHGVW